MKVSPLSGENGILLVTAIHRETINVYYTHLPNINFDESIDMLPTSIGSHQPKPHVSKSSNDVIMYQAP